MKLLVDAFDPSMSEVNSLIKEEQGQKKYYIKGVFAQAETRNRNGRNYPKSALNKALNEYNRKIESRTALGELNHPDHPNVNLERASHIIESLTWDGNNIIGNARVLTEMPMGKVAKGLLDEGVQLGVSTRGLGSLIERNGVNVVQDDYTMTAVDIVSDPSGPDCWVEGVMEGAEWVYNASTKSWVLAEQVKKDIRSMSAKQVAESQALMFERFLRNLK